jgi:hypothetical protein
VLKIAGIAGWAGGEVCKFGRNCFAEDQSTRRFQSGNDRRFPIPKFLRRELAAGSGWKSFDMKEVLNPNEKSIERSSPISVLVLHPLRFAPQAIEVHGIGKKCLNVGLVRLESAYQRFEHFNWIPAPDIRYCHLIIHEPTEPILRR